MNPRKAFTLVELLVVIAIIALLMSILMPALSRAREQAKMVRCGANLKQWGLIAAIYNNEWDGEYWPSADGSPCYWWIKFLDNKHKYWKNNKIWLCPSAQRPKVDESNNVISTLNIFNAWGIYKGTDFGPNGIAGSYGINGFVLKPYPRGRTGNYEGNVPFKNGWHSAYTKGAMNVPLFTEALRFDLWPGENEPPARDEHAAWGGNNMGRCCINRHRGFVEMVFMDLSVRKVGLKELYTLKWHRKFNTGGKFTIAGGVQPSTWGGAEWIKKYPDY